MKVLNKIILFILLLFVATNVSYAVNWVEIPSNGQNISLDTDSIFKRSNSVYYNIKYYNTKTSENLVSTIQATVRAVGISNTCKLTDYSENSELCSTIYAKPAFKMNIINSLSPFYNVNLKVFSIVNSKQQVPSNIDTYIRSMQRKIKMYWDPVSQNDEQRVILSFSVGKNGELLSSKIYQSSGYPDIDNSALHAVEMAFPFKPLPEDFQEETIKFRFVFDNNLFGVKGFY